MKKWTDDPPRTMNDAAAYAAVKSYKLWLHLVVTIFSIVTLTLGINAVSMSTDRSMDTAVSETIGYALCIGGCLGLLLATVGVASQFVAAIRHLERRLEEKQE